MQTFFFIFISLLTVILNSYPYVAGYMQAPPGMQFLGTVHHPQDFYYYLSQFAQGNAGHWTGGTDLFTGEMQTYTLVGWSNILSGRLLGILGFTPIISYQIAVFAGAIAILASAYLLATAIFRRDPDKRSKSQLVVVLFAISNCYPIWTFIDKTWTVTYSEFWFNFGTPFTRLSAIPHHQVAQTAFIVALFFAISIVINESRQKYMFVGVFTTLLILASINPVHGIMALGMIGLLALPGAILYWKNHHKPPLHLIVLVATTTGAFLLPAVYLKTLFTGLPYSQLSVWESGQQLYVSAWQYFLNAGPLLPLAIIGMPFFVRRHPKSTPLVLFGAVVSPLFIFWLTPLAVKLHLGNVRFTTPITTLFWAMLAVEFIWFMAAKFPKYTKQVAWGLAILLALYLSPVTYKQMLGRNTFDTNNAYLYLSDDIMAAYAKAKAVSSPADTWYIQWPFNTTFPGVTGRRSFHGHPLLTINAPAKEGTAWLFIAPQTKTADRKKFLVDNNIKYVMVYPATFKPLPPFLAKIWENNILGIYRVK